MSYRSALYADLQPKRLLSALIVGLIVGFLVWAFTAVLQNYVIEPLFCNSTDNFTICANGGKIASNLAVVFSVLIGLFALVGRGVSRPVMVSIASAVVLWGIGPALGGLSAFEALLWTMGVAGLSYVTFWWFVRIYRASIAALITTLGVILVRLIAMI